MYYYGINLEQQGIKSGLIKSKRSKKLTITKKIDRNFMIIQKFYVILELKK